ncbi:MAG: hypothetical protein K2Q22_02415, partial [Cytophagales bacterium]|nr:hypothetical protein [Cytophagales bacterium]
IKIQVVDVLGKIIHSIEESSPTKGTRSFLWNGQGSPKGVYIVTLFQDGVFIQNQKIVYE